MRILLNDFSGHPFPVQLSRELAHRGHTVLHTWCASFLTPHGALGKMPGDPGAPDTFHFLAAGFVRRGCDARAAQAHPRVRRRFGTGLRLV